MTLGEYQKIFTKNVGLLIAFVYSHEGYTLAFGEATRSNEQAIINFLGEAGRIKLATLIQAAFPELAKAILDNGKANGIINTAHGNKLAVDLLLFFGSTYLTSTDVYKFMGDYWKSLHPLNRWGGDFAGKPDGNHFSMEYGGIK